ncbi:unnamed protein product, partial [Discosporangium mesarthrocarpum]
MLDAEAPTFFKGTVGPLNTETLYHKNINWVADSVDGMGQEYGAGDWASDDLLAKVLETMMDFQWHSHTLTHLARDDLLYDDCAIEDQGNVQIAILLDFYYNNPNQSWRSMTNPRITGLYNHNCLQ